MLTDLVTIPAGASSELEETINQFNSRLSDLHLALAQTRGTDGLTPSFSSDLDLKGRQITNVGQAAGFDSAFTSRTARSKSLYRSKSAKRAVLKELTVKDLTVPITTAGTQAISLNQAEGLIPQPASTVTDETTWGITPAVGVDTTFAREDHTHGSPANPLLAGVSGGFTTADGKTVTVTNGLITSIV